MKRGRAPFPKGCLAPFLAAVLCAAIASGCGGRTRDSRPEAVVLVTLDTTRADRLGCYGNGSIQTPTLDRLAAEGTLFEQAQTVAPFTLPAHTSIMTGRFPVQHGVRHNGLYAVPAAELTLAEAFAASGYDTAAFIAGFPVAARFGLRQGFATWDESFLGRSGVRQKFQFEERDASAVTDAARSWLTSRAKGRPYFLWVHYFDPHVRYTPPSPFRERYAGNPYDGEIAFVDSQLARLLDAVGGTAPPGRTIVAVVGDHGEGLRQHGEASHGFFAYQQTIRVPLLLDAAGRVPAAARRAEPVSVVDLFPTLLRLAGVDRPAGSPPVAGVDLLEPPAQPKREIVYEALMPYLEYGWSPLHGLRDGSWCYLDAPRPELYDLAADPGETKNLLADPAGSPHPASSPDPAGQSASSPAGRPAAAPKERARAMKARLDRALATFAAERSGNAARTAGTSEMEALKSLGYMAAGGSGGSENPDAPPPGLADPKDRVAVSEAINDVALLLATGRGPEAVAASERLLKDWPGERSVRSVHGEALLAAGRTPELLGWIDNLTRSGSAPPSWALALRARALEAEGRTDAAIQAHLDAAAAGGDGGANRLQAAVLLRGAGRLDESTRAARAAGTNGPLAAEALRLIADNDRDLGHPKEALDALRQAEASAPDDPVLLSGLGRALMQAGQIAEARAIADRLASVAPQEADGPLLAGACDVTEGDPRAGLPKLQRALQVDAANADALYWLATAWLDVGDAGEAEQPARRLLEERPDSWLSHRTIGRLLLAQGKRDEAAAALSRALAQRPGDPLATELFHKATAGR